MVSSSSCIWHSPKQLVGMISGFSWETIKMDLVFEEHSTQKDKNQSFSSKALPVMPVGSSEPRCPGRGNWDAHLAHKPTTPTETMVLHHPQHPLLAPQMWNKFFLHMHEKQINVKYPKFHRLWILRLSVGLGISLPLTAKSHCLPSSFLAPFKIHQDQMVPAGVDVLGKKIKKRRNTPASKWIPAVMHPALSAAASMCSYPSCSAQQRDKVLLVQTHRLKWNADRELFMASCAWGICVCT